jgi:hypothetical protein
LPAQSTVWEADLFALIDFMSQTPCGSSHDD